MKKLWFVFTVIGLAMLGLTACGSSATPTVVEAVSVQPAALIAEGRLQPVNSLDQTFPVPGMVSEVLVKDGDSVKAGQVIARLQASPDAQASLVRAQQESLLAQQALDNLKSTADVNLAQQRMAVITAEEKRSEAQERYDEDATDARKVELELAESMLDQAEATLAKLEKGSGVDQDQLAAVEARLASAQAAATSAQAAIEALELRASIDGTAVDVAVQVGQRIPAGQPVVTLADFSTWVVKTDNLTEAEVIDVKPGQKVTVVFDALPEKTLAGEVTAVGARYEEKRGDITYTVTIKLNETDPKLRWGMTAAVQFAQ